MSSKKRPGIDGSERRRSGLLKGGGRVFTVATLALALVAAACGSSGNSSKAATSGGSSPSTSSAAGSSSGGSSSGSSSGGSVTNITISQPGFFSAYAPLYYAQSKGYFKQAGINAKFVSVSGGNELAAVLGGSAQMVVTSSIHPIAALAQGQRFYSFAGVNQGFSEDVVMNSSAYAAAGLSSSSSVKQEIQALANKPVGVISPTGENVEVFEYLFHYAGLPKSAFQPRVLGTPQAVLAALKAGSIVATNLGPPFPAVAVAAGYAKYLLRIPTGVIPPMKDALTEDVSTTVAYYKAHTSLINNFTAALQKAETAIYADPTAAADYLYPLYFSGEPKAAYQSAWSEDIGGKLISQTTNITSGEENYIVQFMKITGQTVPSNWQEIFTKP